MCSSGGNVSWKYYQVLRVVYRGIAAPLMSQRGRPAAPLLLMHEERKLGAKRRGDPAEIYRQA